MSDDTGEERAAATAALRHAMQTWDVVGAATAAGSVLRWFVAEPFFRLGRDVDHFPTAGASRGLDNTRIVRKIIDDPAAMTSLWSVPPPTTLPLPSKDDGCRSRGEASRLAHESCSQFVKAASECRREKGISVETGTTLACRREDAMTSYCVALYVYFLDLYGFVAATSPYERAKIAYYADLKVRDIDDKVKGRSYAYVSYRRNKIDAAYKNNEVIDF